MANQNEEKYQEVIYLRRSEPSPNGIIVGHSYDLIDNEPYIIYFRKLQDYEAYSDMDSYDKKIFLMPYRDIACQKKYQEEQNRRASYDVNFNYKMCLRETDNKFRALLRAGRYDEPDCKVLEQHHTYLLMQRARDKKVCRHCLKVLDHGTYMGNTHRGYRVCMQCKNFIMEFRR